MKFGGTSVADADAMTRGVNIVRRERESHPQGAPPVVVVTGRQPQRSKPNCSSVTARLPGRSRTDRGLTIW